MTGDGLFGPYWPCRIGVGAARLGGAPWSSPSSHPHQDRPPSPPWHGTDWIVSPPAGIRGFDSVQTSAVALHSCMVQRCSGTRPRASRSLPGIPRGLEGCLTIQKRSPALLSLFAAAGQSLVGVLPCPALPRASSLLFPLKSCSRQGPSLQSSSQEAHPPPAPLSVPRLPRSSSWTICPDIPRGQALKACLATASTAPPHHAPRRRLGLAWASGWLDTIRPRDRPFAASASLYCATGHGIHHLGLSRDQSCLFPLSCRGRPSASYPSLLFAPPPPSSYFIHFASFEL